MGNRVCIIGSGPTGIYTLKNLAKSPVPLHITVFEAEKEIGKGTPYLPGVNDPVMLSNIPSIEIPELAITLIDWLKRQPDEYLARFAIMRSLINGRQFYPRLVLGDYFHDQFKALVNYAKSQEHQVSAKGSHRVKDIIKHQHGASVIVEGEEDFPALFDHVVIATGHHWPTEIETSPGYYTSPWPAFRLETIGHGHIGILGTSLSAIDALMTVSTSNGSFIYEPDGQLRYERKAGNENFKATLMSRKGLLPEADFYCPLPYLEPKFCTSEAVQNAISQGAYGLLDKVFELFKQELVTSDPSYAAEIGLADLTVDSFADAYYSRRAGTDPFVWAAANLAEAEKNMRDEHTVPWRYAIMITHEIIAKIAPHLDTEDFKRFNASLKSIFIDEYATVPHLSIKRLLALRNAGVLDILKLGEDYEIETRGLARGAALTSDGRVFHFDGFIEAIGQKALSADDFPFPSLVADGGIKKAHTPAASTLNIDEESETPERLGGVDVDDVYRIRAYGTPTSLYCAAIPYLLHKDPFIQGITSAAEIGETVAQAIIKDCLPMRDELLIRA
ncbi:hypothetical protein G6L28_16550 [Agrobacterium larrymoorei]|uniref:FAD/NAD(P)-binding protein n=1 Tax=Agrobacterium larrymoorei TaxID=160699 RepID=UPI00157224FB|nr:FAD/NAD(P)-binding protein [Agrobacterium larrymoorei]NTJ44211.1 hypothetical protein [Agrobacterium larrymoorei]